MTVPLAITPGAVTNVHDGSHDGAITASTVSGGTTPYTISWTKTGSSTSGVSSPTTEGAQTGLSSGTFVLHVTDNASATLTSTFVVHDIISKKRVTGKAGSRRNRKKAD